MVDAPMDCAASTTPESTSSSEDSTSRATKGAAAMTSGTTVALLPMVVPTRRRVTGMTAIMRMRKGKERVRFTTTSSTLYTSGRGLIPS